MAKDAGMTLPSPQPGRRQFTLIELLVVITIIAILASLLLPALRKATDSARAVTCMNNLMRLGQTTMLYADDSNGFFPYGLQADPATVKGNAAAGLIKGDSPFYFYSAFYNIPGTLFQCPMDRKDSLLGYYWGENANYAPNEPLHNAFWSSIRYPNHPSTTKVVLSYSINQFIFNRTATLKGTGLSNIMVANPGNWGMMTEAARVCVNNGWFNLDTEVRNPNAGNPASSAGFFIDWSHRKSLHFLYGDGHVAAVVQRTADATVIWNPDSQSPP